MVPDWKKGEVRGASSVSGRKVPNRPATWCLAHREVRPGRDPAEHAPHTMKARGTWHVEREAGGKNSRRVYRGVS
jgi:hypothetical protein